MESNQASVEEEFRMIEQIVLGIVFFVAFLFICGGNLLTIRAVKKTPALRTVPNMYVVSLAVVDFITGAIIPYYCVVFYPSLRGPLDRYKYLCLFRYVLFHLCVTLSIGFIEIIAFDRFLYIKYPLHYKRYATPGKAGIVITTCVVISVLLASVPLWDNQWDARRGCDSFDMPLGEVRVYGLVPAFFLCCVFGAMCYGYIVWKAMKHQREAIERRRQQLAGSKNLVLSARNDWKSVKMFLLVYGVFFCCWCPNFILLLVRHLVRNTPKVLVYFTVTLGFLNSGMNFVIYGWKNRHFRAAFKNSLRRGSPPANIVRVV